jgi:hypothetical protein
MTRYTKDVEVVNAENGDTLWIAKEWNPLPRIGETIIASIGIEMITALIVDIAYSCITVPYFGGITQIDGCIHIAIRVKIIERA